MFNGLREGSLFYILHKGENPRLRIGQVMAKSDPRGKNGMPVQPYGFPQETVVDVTVKADDETYTFDSLNSNDTLRFYPEKNVVISDNREQMLAEIDAWERTSAQALETMKYHENVVSIAPQMKCQLNPQLAKEREQEQKIGALEGKITGMENTLCNIQEMLSKALGGSGSPRKSNEK